ncbi:MAG: trypsin-like peptidase domain-containing protein [Flavobacteriales bacterium]|nr:trypsin-like peptidase domain-containing protein [Flavobacteriales bacterium]
MLKNGFKLTTAGIIGGLVTFGLLHTFPNLSNNTSFQSKVIITEKEEIEKNSFKTVNTNPYNNKENSTLDFTSAAEKTVNSVVHIQSKFTAQQQSDPLIEFFWGPNPNNQNPQIATGSGVIISNDGYIVTNNHVIDNADEIAITLNDGRELNATLIGTDPGTDIALLKINDINLPYTEFGNSDEVEIGDWVLAVGNPFNLTSTVTAGIVSAKARNINLLTGDRNNNVFPLESFIQTDAAVNPGNSGGALVSPNGLLVGINTAIASQTGSYSGYSFAVPSNLVLKVVNDIKSYGMVQRAFIGVVIQDVDQKTMNSMKLPNTNGVFVRELSEGGAAKEAGIKENDVILKVDNVEVNDVPELQEQIGRFRPGDKVNVIVRRNNENKLIEVVLRNQSGNTKLVNKKNLEKKASIYGATFLEAEETEMRKLKIKNGVKIHSLSKGKLQEAGLKPGFIITHLDKKPVYKTSELLEAFKKNNGGILIEGVYVNGVKGYYGFGI